MSENTLPVPSGGDAGLPELAPEGGAPGPYVNDWELDYPGETEGGGGLTFERIVLALRRFWWLIGLSLLMGLGCGMLAYRFVAPVYQARAQLLVSKPADGEAGPIEAAAMLEEEALIDLLKGRQVIEPVVMEESLFVSHPSGLGALFSTLQLDGNAVFGTYHLTIVEGGERWILENDAGAVVSEGAVGDGIGREVGFLWSPAPEDLDGLESVSFTVSSPAETANSIASNLQTTITGAGSFINVTYPSTDPEVAARVLNGVLARFRTVAQSLKEVELESNLSSLVEQLAQAEDSLDRVTEQLESFRLATISQPGERATPTPGGIEVLQNPLRDEFFDLRARAQELDRQLRELESIVATVNAGGDVPIPRLEAVERAQSIELSGTLTRLSEMRGELRALLLRYTDEHPSVQELRGDIREIEQGTIPVLIASVQEALRGERSQVEDRMNQAEAQMVAVPVNLMREQQLQREQDRFTDLVTTLQTRRTMAELQFQGSLSDFEIVAEATVPVTPSSDQRLPMAGVVLAGFLGLGLVGAILLDRTDTRFRYPEDVTSGIGVDVLGMIPRVGRSGSEAEVEEAFRDLRMRLMYAHGSAGPLMVVFSSPGPGEGKTLIAANLALAFAKIGRKTLVIDADTRRGDLHRLLGEERGTGLVDYLAGGSDGKIIHRTEYPNLFFMGAGARLSRAPELLAGERVRHLFYKLRERYDVILVDAPPLGAGADAFHLATLTGSMALVLRAGESEKSVVEKKLQALSHLPVRVLGGILNDVSSTALKGYGYYSYYMPGYEAGGEDDAVAEYAPALGPADMPELGERDD